MPNIDQIDADIASAVPVASSKPSDNAPPAHQPRRLSLAIRLLARLGGADPAALAIASADDVMVAVRTGLALVASQIFVGGALFCGLTVALGQGQADAVLIGLAAAVLAGIISFIDHAMIQAHWRQGGEDFLRDLRREEATDTLAGTARVERLAFAARGGSRLFNRLALYAFRGTLSFALAFTVATVLELVIFERDIVRRLESDRSARNAPLLAEMDQRIGAEIMRMDERVRATAGTVAAAQAEERRLGAMLAEREAREALPRAEQRARLEQARAAALEEMQRRRADAIAERQGVREGPQNSGVPGQGARFRNAEAQARAQAERAAALLEDIRRLEAPNPELDAARAALEAVRQRLRGLEALDAAARAGLSAAVAERSASAKAMAVASGSYATPRDGLLLRLEALQTLKSESAALATFAAALKLVLMLAEMGGLASKLLASGASVYAVRAALAAETGAARALVEAEHALATVADARSELRGMMAAQAGARRAGQMRETAATQARERFQQLLDDALDGAAPRH
jgi:hypothetical protein